MKLIKILKEIESKTQSNVYITGEYVYKFLTGGKKIQINDVVIIGSTSKVVRCLNRFGRYSKIHKVFIYNNTETNITIINTIKNKTDDELLKINSKNRFFTIHSLYLPLSKINKKYIKDFVGGLKDIKRKRIRVVGDIAAKLRIDNLLIIQAITLSIITKYSLDRKIIGLQKKICMKDLTRRDIKKLKKCLIAVVTSTTPSKYFKLLNKFKLLKMIIPELAGCVNLKQDINYHKHDVFTHCIYTCDHIENNLILRLAALFHDIGKLPTAKKINKKITFHKHEVAGANIVKQRLKFLGFDQEIITQVSSLVRLHMYHYTREYTDAGVRRFIKKSGLTKKDIKDLSNFPLFKLRIADRLGNGIRNIPVTDRQKDFEERIMYVYDEMHSLTTRNLNITSIIIEKCFNTIFGEGITNNLFNFLLIKVKENPEKNKEKVLLKLTVDYLYDVNYWEL